jgi:hypothetical protein
VLAATARPEELCARAVAAGVPAEVVGLAGGSRLVVDGLVDLDLAGLRHHWLAALPEALGEPLEETA